MPYDQRGATNELKIIGAFSSHPNFEYISTLAGHLRDADEAIVVANTARLKAEGDANKYASELATLQATLRTLREENEALKAAAPAPKKPRPGKVAQVIALPETKKAQ